MRQNSYVGGQAVIEGVMMRSEDRIATAVWKKGRLVFKTQRFKSVAQKHKWLNIPVFRGVIFLFEMALLGMKTLTWSADQQSEKGEQFSNKELVLNAKPINSISTNGPNKTINAELLLLIVVEVLFVLAVIFAVMGLVFHQPQQFLIQKQKMQVF